MREPTDEELKAYADKLPDVFKITMESFTRMGRGGKLGRRSGDSLLLDSIDSYLEMHFPHYRSGDTQEAVEQLENRGFLIVEEEPLPSCTPTRLGERLITAITGAVSLPAEIPELPALTWG